MHYWTCVVQKAIPVFTAYYCSASINIWTVKQPVWLLPPVNEIGEGVVFSPVCLFTVGDRGNSSDNYPWCIGPHCTAPTPRYGNLLYMTHLKMGPHCWCTPTPDTKPDCAGPPRLGTTLYGILHPDIKPHWNCSRPMGFPCPRAEIWFLRSKVGGTHPIGMFYSSLRQIHKYTQTIFITTFIMKKTNKLFQKGVKNVN